MSLPFLPDCTPLVLRCAESKLIDVRMVAEIREAPPSADTGAYTSEGSDGDADAPPAWERCGEGEAYGPTGWEVWSAEGWTPVRRVVRRPVPPGARFLAVATPTGAVCAAEGLRLPRADAEGGARAVPMGELEGATLVCADAPRPTEVAVGIYQPHDFAHVAFRYAAAEPPGPDLPPLGARFLNACPESHRVFSRCITVRPCTGAAPVWLPNYVNAAAMFQMLDSSEGRAGLDTSRAPDLFCVLHHRVDGRPPVRGGDRVTEVREAQAPTAYLWGLETGAPWHQAGVGRLLVASLQ